MKKVLLCVLIFSLVITSVVAQQQEKEPRAVAVGNQDAVPTLYGDDPRACCRAMTAECLACTEGISVEEYCELNPETVGCGDDDTQPELIMARKRIKAETKEELKEMIRERKQEMEQSENELEEDKERPEKVKEMLKNANQVRLAVHSMLAMEDLVGGIGRNVSEIARGFNNSVKTTLMAEEKIQKKGGFARFFTGGDKEAAEELEAQVEQNRARIQELKQLMENCDDDCDEEVKTMLQEQVQNMEQEQNRLDELAKSEKARKGLFGWIWK